MSGFAANDFEAIREALRKRAQEENRCSCEKDENGTVTKTDVLCPSHGKWLGELQQK